ncbi:uncharacterized protein [Typha angustifolia]|uniref:uncharacterized protein n=1 Tax=Typha angustifolia TaxID=59011 RepID=UPI003C2CB834
MSARLLRRVLKEKEEEKRLGSSDSNADLDEESDSPPSAAPSKNPFDLLDEQEDEEEVDGGEPVNAIEHRQPGVRSPTTIYPSSNRKSKKKKKKNKEEARSTTRSKSEKSFDTILEDLSIGVKPPTDQIKLRNIKAVSSDIQAKEVALRTSSILAVDPKFLKAENELRKIFGSKVVNSFENQHIGSSSRQIGGRRAAHNPRKTLLISPSSYWPRWDGSMSMELLETKDGLHYFRYVHSQSYRHAQEAFEAAKLANDLNAIGSILAHYPYHVESLLTFAEVFKYSGENQSSADAIAKCLFALECAWHPLFSPSHGNCQLKYTHDTNKPLFTALFSHMKNMDRRGCHRSALEVCKFLLSLDPDDPMGALFCIDYFSLRAQEYHWLEEFSEIYGSDNSLWLFPNFSYSLPIARFYLEGDAESSTEGVLQAEKATALDLMKQALMLHPSVLQKLVVKAPLKDSAWTQILRNVYFGCAKAGNPSLEHLINIYVERSYIMWRFPELQNLLKDAALMVGESLKEHSREAQDWSCVRKEAFSSEKNEYSHLMVSDFSDTIPSLPPEELRQFMVGPQMAHDIQDGDREAIPERARAPREVMGRNAALVFLESLLPWVDYGDDRQQDHDQDMN